MGPWPLATGPSLLIAKVRDGLPSVFAHPAPIGPDRRPPAGALSRKNRRKPSLRPDGCGRRCHALTIAATGRTPPLGQGGPGLSRRQSGDVFKGPTFGKTGGRDAFSKQANTDEMGSWAEGPYQVPWDAVGPRFGGAVNFKRFHGGPAGIRANSSEGG